MAEAISLAKELNDMHALVVALTFGAVLGHFECNPTEVRRLASELIELSTGDTAEGVSFLENGIADNRATGSILLVPLFLALNAEALHLADRTSEAEARGEARH